MTEGVNVFLIPHCGYHAIPPTPSALIGGPFLEKFGGGGGGEGNAQSLLKVYFIIKYFIIVDLSLPYSLQFFVGTWPTS